MAEVCLCVILALYSHIGPRAKALGPIWLPQCQYDLEAHLDHIIACIYVYNFIFDRPLHAAVVHWGDWLARRFVDITIDILWVLAALPISCMHT